jgi:protein TonB
MPKTSLVYGVSLVVHGALAVGVMRVREPKHRETIAISVAEAKKKTPEPAKAVEPIKSIETKAEAPRPVKAKVAPPAPKADAPPPSEAPKARSAVMDALPNLGISMDNGPGGVGMAVPQVAAAAAAPTAAPAAPQPKVLGPKPDDCTEAVVKPKVKSTSQPSLTTAARDASVEGKVRVEVTVSIDGTVTSARIVAGLGYGLDEASVEAARRATFQPATRCGKAVAGTVVMAFRFQAQ